MANKLEKPHTHGRKKGGKRPSLYLRLTVLVLSMVLIAGAILVVQYALSLGKVTVIPPDGSDFSGVEPSSLVLPSGVSDPGIVDVNNIVVRGNTENVKNFLLLGMDASNISDCMIVMSINEAKKEIRLISFLRDTVVQIPTDNGTRVAKLNAAYSSGGFKRLQETFVINFALQIDEFIRVDFKGLEKIVDAVGGLDVPLTAAELTQIPVGKKNTSKKLGGSARTVHLDGYQTLQYARIRHIGTDFARTSRQQKVLELLYTTAKNKGGSYTFQLLDKLVEYVETNVSRSDINAYAIDGFTKYSSYELITGYHLPEDGQYDDYELENGGQALLIRGLNDAVLRLHQYMYNTD